MAKTSRRKEDNLPMFFNSFNYKLIGLAFFLIIAGFTAMYLENEVNGFISLYVSPIVVMAGYVIVIFAILKHNRKEDVDQNQTA